MSELFKARERALSLQLEQARRVAAELVRHVGTLARCRDCGAEILWVVHRDGEYVSYNATGVVHWATCPLGQGVTINEHNTTNT